MSTEINNQVVQMKFNNQEFEKNVQQTLASLEKLDESLQFKDSAKGFDTLSKAAEEVKVKFSALEVVAISALNNITNKAINAGEKLVRSLSVDNIAAGWQKFEDITTSTGTLFNQGFDMVEIEDQLSRITFFADETSYSLTDMVSNLAKFTSKGTDLKVATRAVEGISLLASTAGKNAADASAVMYQLAQVSNYVKLQDWNSVVMRNMNTLEFQKVIVETAKAAHTLREETDGLYKTISGKKYSMKDLFTSGLSEGWFTYDVLIDSTSKYASAVDDLYDKLQDDKSIETASEAIAKYGDQLDAFGIKAFKAGQEARTWTDVINSVKDAVSSKWQTTFKMILGDYQEARDLFTGLANMLYDAFAAGGDERNDILALWKGLGGREKLLDGLAAGFYAIKDAIDAVKNAFYEIFSSLEYTDRIGSKADKLLSITESFRKTMYGIANFVSKNAKNITGFFKGIFSVVKLVTDGITGIFHALIPATKSTGSLLQIILSLAGVVGKVLTGFTDWIRKTQVLSTVMNALKIVMTVIGNIMVLIINGIARLGSYVKELAKYIAKLKPVQSIVKGLSYVFTIVSISVVSLIENIKELITTLRSPELIAQSNNPIVKVLAWIKNGFVLVGNIIVNVARKIVDFVVALRQISFKDIFASINNFFASAKDWILTKVFGETEKEGKSLIDVLKAMATAVKDLFKQFDMGTLVAAAFVVSLMGVTGALSKMLNAATGLFGNASALFKTINNWIKKTYAKSVGILNIAEAIGILAASLWLLSKVPADDLNRVAVTIGGFVVAMGILYLALLGITKKVLGKQKLELVNGFLKGVTSLMKSFALTMAVVAATLKILETVNLSKELVGKVGIVIGVVALMTVLAAGMSKLLSTTIMQKDKIKSINIVKLSGAILGILALAIAIKKVSSALLDLAGMTTEQVIQGTKALVPLLIAFGVLAAGAGHVKLTSVAALFLLIKLMEKLIPELVSMLEDSQALGKLKGMIEISADAFENIIKILGVVLIATSLFGKNIADAEKGFAMVLTAIAGLMLVMSYINANGLKVLTGQTVIALVALTGMFAIMERLAGFTKGTKLVGLGAALLMMAPTILAMGVLIKMLGQTINEAYSSEQMSAVFWGMFAVMASILGGIALIMRASAYTKNVKLGTLIVLFGGLNILFGEIIALTLIKPERLNAVMWTAIGVFGSLALLIAAIGQIGKKAEDATKEMNVIQKIGNAISAFFKRAAYLAMAIGAMYVIVKILKEIQSLDADALEKPAKIVGIAMGVITFITIVLSNIKSVDIGTVISTLGFVLAACGEIAAIAVALTLLARTPWERLKGATIALNATLGVLLLTIGTLAAIASTKVGAVALGVGLGILAAGLLLLVGAMYVGVKIFKDFADALLELQNAVAIDPIGTIINQIISGAQTILNNADALKTSLHSIGKYMVEGIVLGVNDNLRLAWLAGASVADAYDKGLRRESLINSPSKVQYNNGVFMVLGLCGGILDNLGKAKVAGSALAMSSAEGVVDNAGTMYGAGELTGAAYGTGLDNSLSTTEDVVDEHMTNIGTDITSATTKIAEETINITDLSMKEIKRMLKEGRIFTEQELSLMTEAQQKAVNKYYSSFGYILKNAKQLAGQAIPYLKGEKNISDSSLVKQIKNNVLGGDNPFTGEGGFIDRFKEEFGINTKENAFEQIFGKDGGEGILDAASSGLGKVGSAAEKTKDTLASLKDTVEQQMDLFSEFNLETEMTAEDMLHNMSSQLLGIQGWADNLTVLAARGMNEGLLKMLGDLGPKAYEKVMAFAQMTDDQLNQANNMYQMSLKLPGSAANQVFAGYTYAGEMAAQGFSNALDQYWALIDPEIIGKKTLEDIAAGMTEYTHVVSDASGGAGSAARSSFNDNAPGEEDGEAMMKRVADGVKKATPILLEATNSAISAAMSGFYAGDRDDNGNLKNMKDRQFPSSMDGLQNGAGLSEEAKKRLGISDQVVMTPVLNLSEINKQYAEMSNAYGVHEINVAAAGFDRRIEASRQMENKILTEAFKASNEATFDKFSKEVCAAITSTEKPVTVNISLQGDAQELFKMVRHENTKFTKINGYNALA